MTETLNKKNHNSSQLKILTFSGSFQNKGNIWAVESTGSIIILGVGRDMVEHDFLSEEKLDISYLLKKSKKIKAIILNNFLPKNSGNITRIYDYLETNIPIYCTKKTKEMLFCLEEISKEMEDNITELKNFGDINIGDFNFSYSSMSSYAIGSIAIALHHKNTKSSTYYIDDPKFTFSNLALPMTAEGEILKKDLFFKKKKENTFLVTGFQNLNFINNYSINILAKKGFLDTNETIFFLFYNFDWGNVIKIINHAKKNNWKVKFMDRGFYDFVKNIFEDNDFICFFDLKKEKIDEGEGKKTVYILPLELKNKKILEQINVLDEFEHKEKLIVTNFFSFSGNEGIIAKVFDKLRSDKKSVIFKNEDQRMKLGMSFLDIKRIIEDLKPSLLLSLQNSYKHDEYKKLIKELFNTEKNESKNPVLSLKEGKSINLINKKEEDISSEKKSINDIESILESQRKNLFEHGMLTVLLFAEWINNKLELKTVNVSEESIFEEIDKDKISKKITQYWESAEIKNKLNFLKESGDYSSEKIIKQQIERKISNGLKNFSENSLVMLFIIRQEQENGENIEDDE